MKKILIGIVALLFATTSFGKQVTLLMDWFPQGNQSGYWQAEFDNRYHTDVTIKVKPARGVFASKEHKPKTMNIIPACLSLKEVDSPTSLFFMKYGQLIFAMGAPPKIDSIAFYVRSSEKGEESNCNIKKLKSNNGDYPSIIECTVIYRTKKIAAGEERALHREKGTKAVLPKAVVVSLHNAAEPPQRRLGR